MDELLKLVESLSNPLMAVCAVYIARSISELNTKIAVIIERVDSHEKRITKLED